MQISTTIFGILNTHTTSISNSNATSTTIFSNLNLVSISKNNLNATSTTIFSNLNSVSTATTLSINNLKQQVQLHLEY